jgi:hypothetical protein
VIGVQEVQTSMSFGCIVIFRLKDCFIDKMGSNYIQRSEVLATKRAI